MSNLALKAPISISPQIMNCSSKEKIGLKPKYVG